MKHSLKAAGKYVEGFSWHKQVDQFVKHIVTERPLLHVCSGPVSDFGDVRCDRYVVPRNGGVVADWTALPFADDSFAAVFADPPWSLAHMEKCGQFCNDAIRVAPVVYVMSPWLWVNRRAERSQIWVREFPGINVPILIVRYVRNNRMQMRLL